MANGKEQKQRTIAFVKRRASARNIQKIKNPPG
jgi:hypothetical protein